MACMFTVIWHDATNDNPLLTMMAFILAAMMVQLLMLIMACQWQWQWLQCMTLMILIAWWLQCDSSCNRLLLCDNDRSDTGQAAFSLELRSCKLITNETELRRLGQAQLIGDNNCDDGNREDWQWWQCGIASKVGCHWAASWKREEKGWNLLSWATPAASPKRKHRIKASTISGIMLSHVTLARVFWVEERNLCLANSKNAFFFFSFTVFHLSLFLVHKTHCPSISNFKDFINLVGLAWVLLCPNGVPT